MKKDNDRMFLVEKGRFVVIRNENGIEVCFGSFEEFYKYWQGIDLIGKNYIDYEPVRGLYIDDSNPAISIKNAPVQAYENTIDAVGQIKSSVEDPFFGLSIEGARALRIKQIKKEAQTEIYKKWPLWKQINANAGIYGSNTKIAKDADVLAVIAVHDAAEAAVEATISVDDTKAVLPVWPGILNG